MMILARILFATIAVSLFSLIGIFTLGIKTKILDRILILLVGFAAGGMIGGAFLHLLPEALKQGDSGHVFFYTLIGFSIFFAMERYFYWRHCHEGKCDIHTFTYLNLVGDGVHNFTDGLLIAAAFMTNFKVGLITTIAIALHEIPQEIGDFGILVYGGFGRKKALIFNFICALTAILGGIMGYIISNVTKEISSFLISFTAGGFIYIAASDLIPELHRQKSIKRANAALIAFILGIVLMMVAAKILI